MKTRMTQWVMTATLTFCGAIMMMTSCTNDAIGSMDNPVPIDPPAPQELADYTIIFYGHGGDPSLDICIVENLKHHDAAESQGGGLHPLNHSGFHHRFILLIMYY